MNAENKIKHGFEGLPLGDATDKREKEEDKLERKKIESAPLITKLTPEELREKRLKEMREGDPHKDIGYT